MTSIVSKPMEEPTNPASIPIFANEKITLFIIKLSEAPISVNKFIVFVLYIIDVCVPYVMIYAIMIKTNRIRKPQASWLAWMILIESSKNSGFFIKIR